jgi:UDP-N-acetyl-D-glucosamine dehydrogenase
MNLPGKKVAVIGLGYVGLPLAALCAKQGYPVLGLDTKEAVVEKLQQGRCHIRDESVERLLAEAIASNNFEATADAGNITDCNIYLICVPTPVDENNDPDLAPLQGACRVVGPHLQKGVLGVVESTVFPGTCEQVVAPLLEEISGLSVRDDFYLAHCPERVKPGDPFWTSENIPRVVGATSADGVDLAAQFYASVLGGDIFDVREIKQSLYPKFRETEDGLHISQVPLGSVTKMRSIRDAEAVKAMENTVRDVNIAFVNELAKISDVLDLDVVDIIDGMATKPFGKGPFYPGVGVGGHCIAVDPEWLKAASKKAGYMPEMIQLARMTNNSMPEYTVSILQDLLNEKGYPLKGTKIAVLGVAYKRNVDDPRESPFYKLRDILEKKGAILNIFDSWVTSENNVRSLDECIEGAMAVVIITEHSDMIERLNDMELSESSIEVIVDGRNCLDGEKIKSLNVVYRGIGRRSLATKSIDSGLRPEASA